MYMYICVCKALFSGYIYRCKSVYFIHFVYVYMYIIYWSAAVCVVQQRPTGFLIVMGYFPQKSHPIIGSFAKRALQISALL